MITKFDNFNKFFENKKETMLVSAFPGTGKSYFFNNTKMKVLDSDSSKFDKKYFPDNYIRHIKDNLGKADIIFISSHKDVRDALVKEGLKFYLVYPDRSLKNEYLERYESRGNDKSFVELLSKNWDKWIDELENQTGCTKIVLKSGQYIKDVIKNN